MTNYFYFGELDFQGDFYPPLNVSMICMFFYWIQLDLLTNFMIY